MSLHFRQYFLQQETGKPVIQAVKFETAIKARVIWRTGRSNRAGRNTDADGDRHRMLGDEVVEHGSSAEAQAVQTHIDTSRFVPLVSSGHINRDGPRRTGEDFGVGKLEGEGLSRRNRGVGL